jgi:hypothetical protein
MYLRCGLAVAAGGAPRGRLAHAAGNLNGRVRSELVSQRALSSRSVCAAVFGLNLKWRRPPRTPQLRAVTPGGGGGGQGEHYAVETLHALTV